PKNKPSAGRSAPKTNRVRGGALRKQTECGAERPGKRRRTYTGMARSAAQKENRNATDSRGADPLARRRAAGAGRRQRGGERRPGNDARQHLAEHYQGAAWRARRRS